MIQYNDFSLINNNQSNAINATLNKIKIQEIAELKDILFKLKEQKLTLETLNKMKYSSLISKVNDDILNLEKIVNFSLPRQQTIAQEAVITPYKNATKQQKKKINFFNNNIFANLFKKQNQTNEPQMRYHTIVSDVIFVTHCHSHKQLCSRQIDIIRLLLLYMSLRPTCPYIHSISTLASRQLDIYLSLISEE